VEVDDEAFVEVDEEAFFDAAELDSGLAEDDCEVDEVVVSPLAAVLPSSPPDMAFTRPTSNSAAPPASNHFFNPPPFFGGRVAFGPRLTPSWSMGCWEAPGRTWSVHWVPSKYRS